MSDQVQRWPFQESNEPAIRALTIDVDTHHHLLAALIVAVDSLPGGSQALTAATAELDRARSLPAAMGEDPDPSVPMARQFITAHVAERFDRAPRAA